MLMKTEQLFVLDLDRTMANTRIYDVAERVLMEVLGQDYGLMKQARHETEASGGSFDFIAYLYKNKLPVEEFLRLFAARSKAVGIEAFRNEGATELLEEFNEHQIPFVFMTYGGEIWQRAKLAAAGYADAPTIITHTKQKGALIAEWLTDDNRFEVHIAGADVSADHVVLVDDKAAAFTGLPEAASGYLLQNSTGDRLPSQKGALSARVEVIQSLADISLKAYN